MHVHMNFTSYCLHKLIQTFAEFGRTFITSCIYKSISAMELGAMQRATVFLTG